MRVTLLNYTPHALETLIFTKNTRLRMSPTGLEEVMAWPEERKLKELEYMKNTIQSSWEFVDYIFVIEDVSRAFTHQLVRHRVGTSFAQQAQRVVNMTDFDYITGPSIEENPLAKHRYETQMQTISHFYEDLLEVGARTQDARGVLPTNIATNIVFKANLRTLHDMGLKRLCVKAQGEFQDVFRAMRSEMIRVHPWVEPFIRVQCAWNGTCLFPTFPMEECPVKPHVFNPETGVAYDGEKPYHPDGIHILWESNRAEAQPVIAPDGSGTSHGAPMEELAHGGRPMTMREIVEAEG
jgi:flavin-dependent thymidylate synthase